VIPTSRTSGGRSAGSTTIRAASADRAGSSSSDNKWAVPRGAALFVHAEARRHGGAAVPESDRPGATRGEETGGRTPQQKSVRGRRGGRKSLTRSRKCSRAWGLRLGMDIPGWPPENIEEMAKKLEQELMG
jgi:hypothetical protein